MVEIGKLKSEIVYLEDELEQKKVQNNQEIIDFKIAFQREFNKEVKLDHRISQLKDHIKAQDRKITSLRKTISELVYKKANNLITMEDSIIELKSKFRTATLQEQKAIEQEMDKLSKENPVEFAKAMLKIANESAE